MSTDWGHDDLLCDLAAHLSVGCMVWRDIQLGPAGSPRPDVYTIRRSFSSPRPTCYEIKVTRQDFLSDVTSGKYRKYLDFGAVVFAVPKGLVNRNEVPTGCGLIVRSDKVWRHTRRPVVQGTLPDFYAMQKLLIDGIEREGPRRRLRGFSEYLSQKALAKRHGEEIAIALHDITTATARARQIIEQAENRAATITDRAERSLPDIIRVLAEQLDISETDILEREGHWMRRRLTAAIARKTGVEETARARQLASVSLQTVVRARDQLDRLIKEIEDE